MTPTPNLKDSEILGTLVMRKSRNAVIAAMPASQSDLFAECHNVSTSPPL